MVIYVHTWPYMNHIWNYMSIYDHIWPYMCIRTHMRTYMIIYGYLVIYMAIHICICPYIDFSMSGTYVAIKKIYGHVFDPLD